MFQILCHRWFVEVQVTGVTSEGALLAFEFTSSPGSFARSSTTPTLVRIRGSGHQRYSFPGQRQRSMLLMCIRVSLLLPAPQVRKRATPYFMQASFRISYGSFFQTTTTWWQPPSSSVTTDTAFVTVATASALINFREDIYVSIFHPINRSYVEIHRII